MYINTYNLSGQALVDAYTANGRQRVLDLAAMARNTPWRIALRRLVAYLAIRTGNASWLDYDIAVLEGYLPLGWQNMPHWQLIEYINAEDIGPGYTIADLVTLA